VPDLACDVLVIGTGPAARAAAEAALCAGAGTLLLEPGTPAAPASRPIAFAADRGRWLEGMLAAAEGLCDERLAVLLASASAEPPPAELDGARRLAGPVPVDLDLAEGRLRGVLLAGPQDGSPLHLAAAAVVLAGSALGRLYGGGAPAGCVHALALRAGAELVDMEFVAPGGDGTAEHTGGLAVDDTMASGIVGLYAAGPAVGGAAGAARIAGSAVLEAAVFGRIAGLSAARHAAAVGPPAAAAESAGLAALAEARGRRGGRSLAGEVQALMREGAGAARSGLGLARTLAGLAALKGELDGLPAPWWLEARDLLLTAEAVALAALLREESRGLHRRLDYPELEPDDTERQAIRLVGNRLQVRRMPVPRLPRP